MLAGRCGMDHGKSTLLSEAMDVEIPVLKIEILLLPNVPPKRYMEHSILKACLHSCETFVSRMLLQSRNCRFP